VVLLLAADQASAAQPETFWESARDWLLGVPLAIAITVGVALAAQLILVRAIRKVVRRTAARARKQRLAEQKKATRTTELTDLLMTQRTEQRAEAIGSLLTSVVTITIWSIALMTILPLLGVDIAPLLASAGVVGVALGFGAQTLVKDYLSGIFLIIEDQFGVGDVVDLGPVVGTVEEATLRYTRLRDMSGVVWYVRNGEILRVANRSQGWTLAIVDIPVAYNENLDRVRSIIEGVAADMDDDPANDDMLLGRPTYAGVESVSGDAMFVRVTAKSAPEQQVPLSRAIRERIKLAFDRAGVQVPVLSRPGLPGQPGQPGTGTAPPQS
jgi:moderate conductance mechanosensitive channel